MLQDFFLTLQNAYDRIRHKLGLARFWHVSNAYSDASFHVFGSYRQAVRELRDRFPRANIMHVDREWNVIFYRDGGSR